MRNAAKTTSYIAISLMTVATLTACGGGKKNNKAPDSKTIGAAFSKFSSAPDAAVCDSRDGMSGSVQSKDVKILSDDKRTVELTGTNTYYALKDCKGDVLATAVVKPAPEVRVTFVNTTAPAKIKLLDGTVLTLPVDVLSVSTNPNKGTYSVSGAGASNMVSSTKGAENTTSFTLTYPNKTTYTHSLSITTQAATQGYIAVKADGTLLPELGKAPAGAAYDYAELSM